MIFRSYARPKGAIGTPAQLLEVDGVTDYEEGVAQLTALLPDGFMLLGVWRDEER